MKEGEILLRVALSAIGDDFAVAVPPPPIAKIRRLRSVLKTGALLEKFAAQDFSSLLASDRDEDSGSPLVLPAVGASNTRPDGAPLVEGSVDGYIVYWRVSSHYLREDGRMIITLSLDEDANVPPVLEFWDGRKLNLSVLVEREEGPIPIDEWPWESPQSDIVLNSEISAAFRDYFEGDGSLPVHLVQTEIE